MTSSHASSGRDVSDAFSADKYESIRKLAMVPQPPRNPNKPFTSFRINDILSPESEAVTSQRPQKTSSKQTLSQSKQLYNGHHRHRHSTSDLPETTKHRTQHVKHSQHKQLDNNANNRVAAPPTRIVRPWDASPSPGKNSDASSEQDEEEINVDDDEEEPTRAPTATSLKDVSPLDALMEMANKTFQGLETSEAAGM